MTNRGNFQHLNGNLLAVVSIKTSGYIPYYHNIVSIAVIILDNNLEIDKRYSPFDIDITPSRYENIDIDVKNDVTTAPPYINIDNQDVITNRGRLLKIAQKGLDPFKASELLEGWFEKLGLPDRKKLSVISYNWKFAYPFLLEWMGGPINVDYIFDSRYRDIATMALFLNDYADYHNRPWPFPKIHLKYLCSQSRIIHEHKDNALADCLVIRDLYKHMIRDSIIY